MVCIIQKLYQMQAPSGGEEKSTIRAVFIIDPKKNIQAMLTYPKNIGRNFNEIVRTLEALQVSA